MKKDGEIEIMEEILFNIHFRITKSVKNNSDGYSEKVIERDFVMCTENYDDLLKEMDLFKSKSLANEGKVAK